MNKEINNLIDMADKVIIQEVFLFPPFNRIHTIKENSKFIKTDFNLKERISNLELVKIKSNADDLTILILKDDYNKHEDDI